MEKMLQRLTLWLSTKDERVALVFMTAPTVIGFIWFFWTLRYALPIAVSGFIWLWQILAVFIAVMSLFYRTHGRRLALYGTDLEQLRQIKWHDFEVFSSIFFQLDGYEVQQRGGPQPDGGVDLLVSKDRKKHVVQCKQLMHERVGVATLRETLGVMSIEGADGAIVMTTGEFTPEAWLLEERLPHLRLYDGPAIVTMLKQHEQMISSEGIENWVSDKVGAITIRIQEAARRTNESIPVRRCRKCDSRMVLCYSQKTEGRFWGCGNYPKCQSTLPLEPFEREILAPVSSAGR